MPIMSTKCRPHHDPGWFPFILAIWLLEANADHGVAAATITASAAAADDARARQGLLADMGNLRRRLRPPRLLPLLLADRLLAAPCIVFTVIGLAGRRRRSRYRPLVRDAGFALQGLATLALDRADPGCVFGQLGDQRLGHARIAGRLALDCQIAAQRARGRRAELAVGRCGQASEP